MTTLRLYGLFSLLGAASHATASDATDAAGRLFFENKIRPVLVTHCFECHSQDAKELGGKLYLDSREATRLGGESGPALIPGNPDESLLIQAVRRSDEHRMPPEIPLPDPAIHDLETWVKMGAPDPRSSDTKPPSDPTASSHWSFQPVSNPSPPGVENQSWPLDPLDHFVLTKIESAQQTPTSDAPPQTLVRRLHYDLTGLPPDHADVARFTAAHATDKKQAVTDLVDRLLASPQFGERWARHWLDLARYGESNGNDGLGRNPTFPNAWRYRDYVIDALNRDTPYDRFLTEQIAGDLLPFETAGQRNRQLTATGFLAIGAKPAAAMNNNFAMDVVDDQINTVSTAAMALSVSCARCHDHKHDPVPARDYYALAGIFKSTETLWGAAANEKLTAPPTPLHELRQSLGPAPPSAPLVLSTDYAAAIDALHPTAHARLDAPPDNFTIEKGITTSKEFAALDEGRLRLDTAIPADTYSVAFWFRNDLGNASRPITAYLFSHAASDGKNHPGDHLGIGGTHDTSNTGKLYVWNGIDGGDLTAGSSTIAEESWNHIVMVRDGKRLRVYLNGWPEPEIDTGIAAAATAHRKIFVGARSDNFAPLTGGLAGLAVFDRALTDDEATQLHAASGQKPKAPTSAAWAMGVRENSKIEDCKINIDGDSKKLGPAVPRGFITACKVDPNTHTLPPDQSGRLQLAQWLTHPKHPLTARVIVNRIWLHLFGQAIVSTPDDFGIYGSPPSHPELLDHLATRFVGDRWSLKQMIRTIVLSRTYQLDSQRTDPQLVTSDPDNRLFARHNRRRLDAESLRDSILNASGQLDLQPADASAIANLDQLINWPPGEATNLHKPSNHRSIYLCMLRDSPPPELAAFDLPRATTVTGKRDVTTVPAQALFLLNSPFVIQQSKHFATKISLACTTDAERVRTIYHTALQRDPSPTELDRALAHHTSSSWQSLCQALLASNEFRYID